MPNPGGGPGSAAAPSKCTGGAAFHCPAVALHVVTQMETQSKNLAFLAVCSWNSTDQSWLLGLWLYQAAGGGKEASPPRRERNGGTSALFSAAPSPSLTGPPRVHSEGVHLCPLLPPPFLWLPTPPSDTPGRLCSSRVFFSRNLWKA